MRYRVIADTSLHKLPVGTVVEKLPPSEWPDWSRVDHWYTQGIEGDERAIAPEDLEEYLGAEEG